MPWLVVPLLLHGASTSLLDFHASLVPPLAQRHRVVAIDRPGHGYSERPASGAILPGAGRIHDAAADRSRADWPDPAEQARLLLDDGLKDAFAPNAPPPDYLGRTGVALTLRPDTFPASAENVRRLSPFLERQSAHDAYIRRPLLLIAGDADDVVPAWNHAERLVQQAPLAELVRLLGVGHGLHHVATERVAALIEDFARRTAPEPAVPERAAP